MMDGSQDMRGNGQQKVVSRFDSLKGPRLVFLFVFHLFFIV